MALSNVDSHSLAAARASVDLSEKQFHYVKLTEDGELALCGAGEAGYVLIDKPKEGEFGTYVIGSQRQKVSVKAAIKVGDELASDASAQAVKAAEGNVIVGIAREAGASGDIVESLTVPPVAKA